jgi:4-hydroxy-tetrahydrodipicolinate reductase
VIDFSTPNALGLLLERHADTLAGRALVVGTTGLASAEEDRLAAAAERGPVLVAANFSVGVNVLLALVERAGRVLQDYDAEIVEVHHRGKVDAPSGTALALGRALARGRGVAFEDVRQDGRSGASGPRPDGQVGMHALRGGGVVGDHHVHLLGPDERIELAHVALDRGLFARGALLAARWLTGRPPGRYTMAEVLGLAD